MSDKNSIEKSQDNKRIAKNTLFMYFRMFVIMVLGLYTSRLVLKTLGAEDFGLYNVIGGVIAMFGFINGAMTNTTSRFITFYLNRNDKDKLRKVFSMSFYIHAFIALTIIILGETIGLWYVYNKLVVPEGRLDAAFWLYQFSIASTVLNILYVPYNATVVAHEKMKAFAYISIMDAFLKFILVISLSYMSYDQLIIYGVFIFLITAIDIAIYYSYCRRHFEETNLILFWDKSQFKEMFGFAGWSMLGNFSYLFYSQGLNLILNIFCGTAVNAARGVAVQVENVVRQFAINVQTAINPQIIKSYSENNLLRMHTLIFASSRYCFYLLFILSLPLILETDFILNLWLEEVPDHTINFIRIILVTTLLDAFVNPMFTANLASGKVKVYQITVSLISYTFMPITYLALKYFGVPELVFVCLFLSQSLSVIARLFIMRYQVKLAIREYLSKVVRPILSVIVPSVIFPVLILSTYENGWIRFIVCSTICIISILVSTYLFGIKGEERVYVKNKIKQIRTKF